jgi:phospholipase/carboxylesterase
MKYTIDRDERRSHAHSRAAPVASVILLHGLGADGWDFVPIVAELGLPDALPVRFVFPHAPVRPVTVNNGYEMRAWYDIKAFTPEGRADAAGLAESVRRVDAYLRAEIAGGVAASRIVLAGFSQGGAVALSAGLRFGERLAGLLALSTYLPFPETLAAGKSAANAGRANPDVPRPDGPGGAGDHGHRSARRAHGRGLCGRVARVPDAARGVRSGTRGDCALATGASGGRDG